MRSTRAGVRTTYSFFTLHRPYDAIRGMAAGFGWERGFDTSTAQPLENVLLEIWSSGVVLKVVAVSADVDADGPFARASVTTTGLTSP